MTDKFTPGYYTMNELYKKDSIYSIPINQRKYSWKKDQYEEYWNDIISIIDDQDKRHYLGVITLVKKEKSGVKPQGYEIIDGQQRMLTTLLFICALRDVYIANNNIVKAKKIHSTYLTFETARDKYNRIVSSRIDEYTLNSLVYINCEFLNKLELCKGKSRMLDNDPSEFLNDNMINAYDFFYKKIFDGYESNEYNKEYLIEIEELLAKIEVITVVSDDIANIFLYFDSLNNRGLQLTQMDIIRNKFFSIVKNNFKDKMNELGELWDELVTIIDNEDCVKFLKYFYMCEKENIFSAKELPSKYENMFNEVKNSDNMEEIINKMIEYAKIYVYLFSKEYNENNGIVSCLKKINFLGQQACYSFIMDYFYYVKDSSRRIYILKEVFKMNYKRIICNCSTKSLDGIFRNIIKVKGKSKKYDDDEIVNLIEENSPKNSILKRDLKNKIWEKDNMTFYTLYLFNSNIGQADLDITNKQKFKIEFLPFESKVCKDIFSCILIETSKSKEVKNLDDVKKASNISGTKYICEHYCDDEKDGLIDYVIDCVVNEVNK